MTDQEAWAWLSEQTVTCPTCEGNGTLFIDGPGDIIPCDGACNGSGEVPALSGLRNDFHSVEPPCKAPNCQGWHPKAPSLELLLEVAEKAGYAFAYMTGIGWSCGYAFGDEDAHPDPSPYVALVRALEARDGS